MLTLHPRTVDLIQRFSAALAEKLTRAQQKYGYRDSWADADCINECRAQLYRHLAKGDPLDVAAYCAFLWHHAASTAPLAVAQWQFRVQLEDYEGPWIDCAADVAERLSHPDYLYTHEIRALLELPGAAQTFTEGGAAATGSHDDSVHALMTRPGIARAEAALGRSGAMAPVTRDATSIGVRRSADAASRCDSTGEWTAREGGDAPAVTYEALAACAEDSYRRRIAELRQSAPLLDELREELGAIRDAGIPLASGCGFSCRDGSTPEEEARGARRRQALYVCVAAASCTEEDSRRISLAGLLLQRGWTALHVRPTVRNTATVLLGRKGLRARLVFDVPASWADAGQRNTGRGQ